VFPDFKGQNEVEGIIPSTFSKNLVLSEHRRSPDLLFVLNADDEKNDFGYQGTCYFDNQMTVGSGIHGGLHPTELNCVLMAMGSFFQERLKSKTPSGIVDILPTMLTGLELPIPEHVAGRVLYEALQKPNPALPEIEREAVEVGRNGFRQRLDLVRVGHHQYIDAGKRLQ
jgi:hypothetical protein